MYMFLRCEKLTESPVLPDATLAERCYSNMFSNCPKLSNVTCLATSASLGSATDPFNEWLYNSGTASGCERIVYVDPSMLNPATDIFDLATSGEDGKRWTLATNDYAHLTSANIGNMLAADGNIYANTAAATAAGTPAVAVIAYVGNVSNYFDKFLAIALTDVDGTHTWTDALTKVGEYAAAHPITIGGTTYNTSTTGDTYYDLVANDQATTSATATSKQTGWRMPSVTDLRYIFDGLGRQKAGLTLVAKSYGGLTIFSENATPTNPKGVQDMMRYCNGGNGHSLLAAINTACGNDALQSNSYWSSSQLSSESNKAWVYYFQWGQIFYYPKTNGHNVRAVFAY